MSAQRMKLERSSEMIARAREDYFLIAVQGARVTVGLQDGKEAILHAGDFALFDSTRPYEARFMSEFKHVVLKVPRSILRHRIGPVEALSAIRIAGDKGTGKIASQLLRTLPPELSSMNEDAAKRLASIFLDVLAAAFAEHLPNAMLADTAARIVKKIKIKCFIEENLSNPQLTLSFIAAAIGVSVRYMNMLLDKEELSLARYILDRRLERCQLALADRAQRSRSISAIAYACGFNDSSHFSHAFKTKYGMSPKDFRQSRL